MMAGSVQSLWLLVDVLAFQQLAEGEYCKLECGQDLVKWGEIQDLTMGSNCRFIGLKIRNTCCDPLILNNGISRVSPWSA